MIMIFRGLLPWRCSRWEDARMDPGRTGCNLLSNGGMPGSKYAAYEAARPYFELVRRALGDLVEGEHFFDIVADDLVFEVLYDFPGWPRIVRGRTDLMA